MITNLRELRGVRFNLQEVIPPALEAAARSWLAMAVEMAHCSRRNRSLAWPHRRRQLLQEVILGLLRVLPARRVSRGVCLLPPCDGIASGGHGNRAVEEAGSLRLDSDSATCRDDVFPCSDARQVRMLLARRLLSPL